jgi:hypothetical protein
MHVCMFQDAHAEVYAELRSRARQYLQPQLQPTAAQAHTVRATNGTGVFLLSPPDLCELFVFTA